MRYLLIATCFTLLLSLSFPGVAQDAEISIEAAPDVAQHILRQPGLSPDGETLAFIYDGDVWSVPTKGGIARRLTITVGNENNPIFSPDGKWLAFRSRRYGSDNVFVMPAEGGPAKRLTYADSTDIPHCWLPDSSGIIFSSYRRENSRDLWIVRLEGGEPWPITGGGFGVHEYDASISPDGKRIVYTNRGGDPARRRGYHGHADGDIWICDFDGIKTSNHKLLTKNLSHDAWPLFIENNRIAYVTYEGTDGKSSRVGDLAFMDADGKRLPRIAQQQVLDPKELTAGGINMAFSSGNYGGWNLYVWQMGSRHPFRVTIPEIKLASDVRQAGTHLQNLTSASEFEVSPDGKKIAFIAGGDVFVMPADEGAVPIRLTDTLAEEKWLRWGPDSDQLVWSTVIEGGLYHADLLALKDGEIAVERLLPNRAGLRNPVIDDVGRIFCIVDEQQIEHVHRIRNDKIVPAVMLQGVQGHFHSWSLAGDTYRVSSGGQWILHTQTNPNYDNQIMLADTMSGEVRPISFLFGSAAYPRFSTDGKRVVFTNNQEGDYDVWSIELTPEDETFKEDKLAELFKKDEKKAKKEDGEEEPPAGVPVEFEGLKDRVTRLTSMGGHERFPVSLKDGKTFCFIATSSGQTNIWKLTNDPDKGPDLKQLTQSRSSKTALSLSADEKTLWWLDGGKITSMGVGGGKTTTYAFSIEQRRNRAELREAAFEEAAWVMGNYYYDRTHHGIDWQATTARYRDALHTVRTGDEYGAIMNELLGELNSSHQGYSAVDDRSDRFRESTGCLGLLFDPVALSKGEWIISEVVKGGPCDLREGTPAPGNLLRAVNGTVLQKGMNLSELLVSTIGKKTVLTFFNGDGEWDLAVKPISRGAEYGLFYTRWVEHQREMVDRLSAGRLGYVHIRAMNDSSLREFKHHLGNEMLGKDGVVIDVRYNGGGRTAVDVLEILIKRPWLLREWGGRDRISENIYRSVALEKPSILLINQASFSNAEIMAEGFRKLEIGKIVGVDTAGGVIGTGRYTLIDGSTMRLPSSGAYTVEGENLELVGRKPDIFIENHPDELDQGIDRQTEAAVKELLKQIDE